MIFYPLRKIFNRKSQSSNNIVILSFHKLGDTVFTIPAIREIIKKYKNGIYIFCYPESEAIYKEFIKDKVFFFTFSKDQFHLDERIASSVIRSSIKKLNPQIIFDLTASIKSSSCLFNISAIKIVGSNDEHYKYLYTHFVRRRNTPHLVDRYLDIINQIIDINTEYLKSSIQPVVSKNHRILIHPFAGWKAKEWNLRNVVELAKRLTSEFSVGIIFTKDNLTFDQLTHIQKEDIDTIETNSISDLIERIKECEFFIGSDSGPLYIASLLGKPTMTFYGPTNPKFSKPDGVIHSSASVENLNCLPNENNQYCYTNAGIAGCPDFLCMNSLSVDKVYDQLIKYMRTT